MRRVLIVSFLVAGVVLSGGCGSVYNLATGDPEAYGGVRRDLEFITRPKETSMFGSGSGEGALVVLALIPAEVGLSLLVDTLTLPLVVYLHKQDAANAPGAVPAKDGGDPVKPPPLGVSLGKPQPVADAGISSQTDPTDTSQRSP